METALLQHIFGKDRLENVPLDDLEQLLAKYPYFAAGQLLLIKKVMTAGKKNEMQDTVLQKIGLYLDHPLLLRELLAPKKKEPKKSLEETAPEAEQKTETVLPSEELFQPLFSRDYFASQGIRLPDTLIHDTKRPTMAELRSFTDWLKTTRRSRTAPAFPVPGAERVAIPEDKEEDPAMTAEVEKMAFDSIDSRDEIVTEAMAEVWARQGQADRAVHIYEKLGLLNPGKSSYFAGKILEIKHSNS